MCPWIPGLDKSWFHRIQSDEEQYDEAVSTLLAFSFVRQNFETSSMSIHPIVHQWSLSLYGCETQKAFLEKAAEMTSRLFLWENHMYLTSSEEAMLNRLRPHADRCIALVGKEVASLGWAAATLISFGAYLLHQYQIDCAKLFVEGGLRCLECQELDLTSTNSLYLRMVVDDMYTDWDQNDDDIVANLCAAREEVQLSKLHDKNEIAMYDANFLGRLGDMYVKQMKYAEVGELWHHAVERWAKEDVSAATYWMAMSGNAGVRLDVGEEAEAIRLGEEVILNLRRLLGSDATVDPSKLNLECSLLWTQGLVGMAYTVRGDAEKSREYFLSSLIGAERLYGPASPITLSLANDYNLILSLDESEDDQSSCSRQKRHDFVRHMLQARYAYKFVQSERGNGYQCCENVSAPSTGHLTLQSPVQKFGVDGS